VPSLHSVKRVFTGARECLSYVQHLSNGIEVTLARARRRSPPPLRFRSGLIWNHGPYDQPILLFREIYVDGLLPSVADAPQGATVVDIGANIGAASLFWSSERPDLLMNCYEPNPQAFATLEANVAGNRQSNFRLYPEAVAREAGHISLWIDVPTALSTAYGDAPTANGRKVDIPSVTLEQVVERAGGDVWLLKIDTEGAEGDILNESSKPALQRCHKVLVEWHDNIVPGVSQIVRQRLAEADFTVVNEQRHPWDEGIIYAVRKN
jgi:FkbM family methyltransferase